MLPFDAVLIHTNHLRGLRLLLRHLSLDPSPMDTPNGVVTKGMW
jgi:hypothetical protein